MEAAPAEVYRDTASLILLPDRPRDHSGWPIVPGARVRVTGKHANKPWIGFVVALERSERYVWIVHVQRPQRYLQHVPCGAVEVLRQTRAHR